MRLPILIVTHMDELRKFDSTYHNSIMFDDMEFAHMPETAQIHLVDYHLERAIHCRYNVAKIPPFTQKVFTSNNYPFSQNLAISRRIKLIKFI
jgi:hypothetical protein